MGLPCSAVCRTARVATRSVAGRLRLAATCVALGLLASLPASAGAHAGPPRPTVTDFAVSPDTVGVPGAPVTVSGTVTGAERCTLSSASIPGLPLTVPCTEGKIVLPVTLPPNQRQALVAHHVFTLEVFGSGGIARAQASASVAKPPRAGADCLALSPGAQNVELGGCNLSYGNFEGDSFVGAHINGVDLAGANLNDVASGAISGVPAMLPTGWTLVAGYLVGPGANLRNAELAGAELKGAALAGADMEGADLARAELAQADLVGANLIGANLRGADVSDSEMEGTNLEGGKLREADVQGADLAGANLTRAFQPEVAGVPDALPEDWQDVGSFLLGPTVDLEGDNLSGLDLNGVDLEEADLDSAELEASQLEHGNMQHASLESANLARADAQEADLRSASLQHADLNEVILSGADLAGASLIDATLRAANLRDDNLAGADLESADVLEAALEGATWQATTCPDGTNSSEDGGTCEGHLGGAPSAGDAAAEELAQAALKVAEAYGEKELGSYAGLTPQLLHELDPAIRTSAGARMPYISEAAGTEGDEAFQLTATSITGHTFSIARARNGEARRYCAPVGKVGEEGGGCQDSYWGPTTCPDGTTVSEDGGSCEGHRGDRVYIEDAAAEELAKTALTAAESFGEQHLGSFEGLTPQVLHEQDPAIQIAPGGRLPYVIRAFATEAGAGFELTATSISGHTFSFNRERNGETFRPCTPLGRIGEESGACQSGSWGPTTCPDGTTVSEDGGSCEGHRGDRIYTEDAAAEELAKTASTAAETYAEQHLGSFEGLTPQDLHEQNPAIQIVPGGALPYLSSALAVEQAGGFELTVTSITGHSFSIRRSANGETRRYCTPREKTGEESGGCQNSTW